MDPIENPVKQDKPEKHPLKNFSDLPKALRERATDTDSLSHFVGPKNISGVRLALLIIADIISGDGELIHKPVAATKRRID